MFSNDSPHNIHGRISTMVYPKDSWLPNLHDGFDGVRLIEAGEVALFVRVGNRQKHMASYGVGEWLGIYSIFHTHVPSMQWKVTADLTCQELPTADLIALLEQDRTGLRMDLQQAANYHHLALNLALHPIFGELPEPLRSRLVKDSHISLLYPKQHLTYQDQPNHYLYLIIRGALDIYQNGSLLTTRFPHEILGEISLLCSNGKAMADVISKDFSEVMVIPESTIHQLTQEHHPFHQDLLKLGELRLKTIV